MTLVSWIKTRLAGRSDSEHEQATLRVLIGIGLIAYLHHGASKFPDEWLYASQA